MQLHAERSPDLLTFAVHVRLRQPPQLCREMRLELVGRQLNAANWTRVVTCCWRSTDVYWLFRTNPWIQHGTTKKIVTHQLKSLFSCRTNGSRRKHNYFFINFRPLNMKIFDIAHSTKKKASKQHKKTRGPINAFLTEAMLRCGFSVRLGMYLKPAFVRV